MKHQISLTVNNTQLNHIDKDLPDLNPLHKAEINYLCIEKCSERPYND